MAIKNLNKPGVITIDDGTRELKLVNTFGEEICKLHIRTGDISILDRYNDLNKAVPEIIKPLEKVSIKNDGTSDFDDDWKIIKEVEENLMQKLSDFFDTDDVRQIFKKRHPFSSVGGQFFVIRVLEGLSAEIARVIAEEMGESSKRMSKYLTNEGGEPVVGRTT